MPSKSNKQKLIDWLNEKGIAFNAKKEVKKGDTIIEKPITKKELLEIVYEHFEDNRSLYKIEVLAEKYGHKIIFLPPYHPELNPIELCWGRVKNYIALHNTTYRMKIIL